jgi:nucleoid-associated protein YgaU
MAVIPEGSTLSNKLGPLPTWVWMALGLLGALMFSLWKKNKATAAASTTDTTSVPDQTPPVIFQNSTYLYNTDVDAPPVGGRPTPPIYTTLPVATVPPTPKPGPGSPPTPVPKPNGQWVTVSKFTTKNPPWNSTLWGISQHLLGAGSKWQSIWNAPQNATLKSRRKAPEKIQPNDKIWVPAK